MKRITMVCLSLMAAGLHGCAANFGADHEVTRIKVMSKPSGIPFVLLSANLNLHLFKMDGNRFVPADSVGVEQRVNEAMLGFATSDDKVLTYAAGRHILALSCRGERRFETIELHRSVLNTFTVSCQ